MKKLITLGVFVGIVTVFVSVWYLRPANNTLVYTEVEPGFGSDSITTQEYEETVDSSLAPLPPINEPIVNGRVQWAAYWQPMTPEEERVYGARKSTLPLRVGIQAGHYQLENVPKELEGLRASSGAQGGGFSEQETVLKIAELTKKMLEAEGITVDLLPATVPVDYSADAFVSIHADGSTSANTSGFKIAGPRTDFSGKAQALADALSESYEQETGMRKDPNITRRMSSYYAFNWRRYDHAIHPRTPAVIVETGFMTNSGDRAIIVDKPAIPARGIANGIITFLKENY